MKLSRRINRTLVTAALCSAFIAPCLGAQLRLTLRTDQPEVVAGFPVVLQATLSTAGGAIEDVPEISPGIGNVVVSIEPLAGVPKRYLGPRWGIIERGAARYTVTSSTPVSTYIPILFHTVIEGHSDLAPEALPLTPGRYRINLTYLGLGADAPLSATISVTVRRPVEAGESAYWKAMNQDPVLAESIQLGTFARHEEFVAAAEDLLQRFPEARHSTATALALARYYNHVQQNARKAESVLGAVTQNADSVYLSGEIDRELAEAREILRRDK